MGEKDIGNEDVGLSLSLSLSLGRGCSSSPPPLKPQRSVPMNNINEKSSWNELFQLLPQVDRSTDMRPLFGGGINMNSMPSTAETPPDCNQDNRDSSPNNSSLSSGSGCKRSEREEDNGAAVAGIELASCSRGSDDEDGGGGEAARKKLRLTKEQSMLLEETFKQHNTLNPKQKQTLAKELNLRARQVEVWFQNRRARTKLKQTEVDCEYLKRYCENLSEENRRLQKEVQELRTLKLSPQLYMHMNPPTTLTMCPSCERVAVSSASSSNSAAASTAHVPALQSNCNNSLGPNIQRPVRVNTWPFDSPISRP
ncbi:homeobox-leucine zipper protein HAT1-like isoform X2 [Arachis stenosperma]|uniref:homeobox-leucine zipper protein HAT1-like isoform X2 n=1 Tax=Arachis stenosperma TaxID=217475 RepID=UPI0025AD0B9C|nr:homeobox-leucine zipper protein HAT1-like isoform X2 [Arachis stenosperma]